MLLAIAHYRPGTFRSVTFQKTKMGRLNLLRDWRCMVSPFVTTCRVLTVCKSETMFCNHHVNTEEEIMNRYVAITASTHLLHMWYMSKNMYAAPLNCSMMCYRYTCTYTMYAHVHVHITTNNNYTE